MRRVLGTAVIWACSLAATMLLAAGCSASSVGENTTLPVLTTDAPAPSTTTVGSTTTTTTTETTTTTTTTVPGPPEPMARYVVAEGEVAPDAKQLATDIAYALTTYEATDSSMERLTGIGGQAEFDVLLETSEPLNNDGRWSRGEIIYPQLGGLTDDRVSVMVVTRQTVGSGSQPDYSVVRTMDIRLVMGDTGWEFEALASAGGAFDDVEGLVLAHAVAGDPRIEMPDSARLDILDGKISPILLQLMADMADITPFGVTVMATGHPYHVFETNRVSHHTGGRAIDIYQVGTNGVIDDRTGDSASNSLMQWLWRQSRVVQVGSPWDIDGGSSRSFANTVHQDHIHVAVVGPNDPDWVPAIGNLVWEDLDADGLQDSGEPGIGGVTVRLFNASGASLGSTVTGADGSYSFRNLSYGEYRVGIDIPNGYIASPVDRGSDDEKDSDINASGAMAKTTLDPREDDRGRDAGLYRLGSIGDFVWEDLDGDGIQDQNEEGIEGVRVRLLAADGTEVDSMVTDDDGEYAFTDLIPGSYRIEIEIPDGFVAAPQDRGPGAEDDDTADSDIDDRGVTALISLHSGKADLDWDAGLVRPASIGNFVWDDLDADGIQDSGEVGVGGITVRLLSGGGTELRTTVTDGDGAYRFEGLPSGVYRIKIDIPDGLASSPRNRGSDDAVDSDINGSGVTQKTTLTPGENDSSWDAGLHPAVP